MAGRQARPGGGVGRRVEGRGLAGHARHERARVVGLHARRAAGRPRPAARSTPTSCGACSPATGAAAAAARRARGGRAARRALAARARELLQPRGDRGRDGERRLRAVTSRRGSRPRRWRAASRRPTSSSRPRGVSASTRAHRRDRGLAQRDPLRARRRDGGRSRCPTTSSRPATTRSRRPISCSTRLDELTVETVERLGR